MKKKIVLVSLVFALVVGHVSAIDFAMGGTFGFGMPVFRGDDSDYVVDIVENWEEPDGDNFLYKLMAVSPLMQMDVYIGITPYLLVETGIGFRSYAGRWKNPNSNETLYITSQDILIPVMVRGKYDIGIFSVYASTGAKFIIPGILGHTYYSHSKGSNLGVSEPEQNDFLMDWGFAVGAEVKLGKMHVGLRGSYDLNLVSPLKDAEFYHDNLNLSITFRDAF